MPCVTPTQKSLVTVHHEVGHIEYYLSYRKQPFVFRKAASQGFQEAIGDVIALSLMVPSHLKDIGLLDKLHDDKGKVSDCVHTMPAHFENGEKCDGSKI